MASILHLQFRVRDQERTYALYSEILDGRRSNLPQVLVDGGVIGVRFSDQPRGEQPALADSIEFWPVGQHWDGFYTKLEEPHLHPYGHTAFETARSHEEIAKIAARHGAKYQLEDRGPFGMASCVYDFDGNLIECFPRKSA